MKQLITETQQIATRTIFPDMQVDWNTYANHISHEESPGCFRCHDDSHVSTDGQLLSQDCDVCHNVLAWEEDKPDLLVELGF